MPLSVFAKGEQAKPVGLIKHSLKKSSKSMGETVRTVGLNAG